MTRNQLYFLESFDLDLDEELDLADLDTERERDLDLDFELESFLVFLLPELFFLCFTLGDELREDELEELLFLLFLCFFFLSRLFRL